MALERLPSPRLIDPKKDVHVYYIGAPSSFLSPGDETTF